MKGTGKAFMFIESVKLMLLLKNIQSLLQNIILTEVCLIILKKKNICYLVNKRINVLKLNLNKLIVFESYYKILIILILKIIN